MKRSNVRNRFGATLVPALVISLVSLSARPVEAQHGGIAATLNFIRYDDRFTGASVSAKGFGFEAVGGGIDGNSLYGFASLDFYHVEPGATLKQFGVFNVGFKVWPKAFEPGFRPWLGGAIGLGGGDQRLTPVVLGGVGWKRKGDGVGLPFFSVEYATKFQRTRFVYYRFLS